MYDNVLPILCWINSLSFRPPHRCDDGCDQTTINYNKKCTSNEVHFVYCLLAKR